MAYYVKMLGSTDMPMPNHPWGHRDDAEDEVRFPAKPAPVEISPGDELVYYAVGGYKRVFATARIEGAPRLTAAPKTVIEKRWPYVAKASLRPSTKLQYVKVSGPELAQIGLGLQEQVGHGVSHFEIGRAEFERAVKLLQLAQTEDAKRLKKGWTP